MNPQPLNNYSEQFKDNVNTILGNKSQEVTLSFKERSKKLHARLETDAKAAGMTTSDYVLQLLRRMYL
jgi:hypothetical protein